MLLKLPVHDDSEEDVEELNLEVMAVALKLYFMYVLYKRFLFYTVGEDHDRN